MNSEKLIMSKNKRTGLPVLLFCHFAECFQLCFYFISLRTDSGTRPIKNQKRPRELVSVKKRVALFDNGR